jgi:hypothetical protein
MAQAMKKRKISKARMTALLKPDRTQVDRLLMRKMTSLFQAFSERRRLWGGV